MKNINDLKSMIKSVPSFQVDEVNPYQLLGGLFTESDGAMNITAKESYVTIKRVGGKVRGHDVEVIKTRVKKDAEGNPVYVGGEQVKVYTVGSLEIHMDHDKDGRHQIRLMEVASGTFTGRINFQLAVKQGLIKALASGKNVWERFPQ